MQQHLLDLLQLSLIIGLAAASLAGWGGFVAKVLAVSDDGCRFSAINVFLGFALVSLLGESIHLFVKIDWRTSLLLLATGLMLLLATGQPQPKKLLTGSVRLVRSRPLLVVLTAMLVFLFLSLAMRGVDNYDSGLYHFQVIRWINEYPLVTGLGNLHQRLAFNNQGYFPWLALLNLHPLWGKGYVAGGLVLLLSLLALLFELRIQRAPFGTILFTMLLVPIATYAHWVGSPSPDAAVAIIQVAIFLLLLDIILSKVAGQVVVLRPTACIVLLCVTLVNTKLSGAVFALASLALLAFVSGDVLKKNKSVVARLVVFGLVAILVHLYRGYLLSGYPLHPSIFGAASNADWAIPIDDVIREKEIIYAWARLPRVAADIVLSDHGWIIPWLGRQKTINLLMLASPLSLLLLNVLIPKRKHTLTVAPRGLYLLYTPLLAAVVFWFSTAPDFRFLGATPMLLGVLTAWLLLLKLHAIKLAPDNGRGYLTLRILVTLPLLLLLLDLFTLSSFDGWRPIPRIENRVMTTNSGLRVNITPEGADQCWNTPLPCTPYFNPDLSLRPAGPADDHPGFSVRRRSSLEQSLD